MLTYKRSSAITYRPTAPPTPRPGHGEGGHHVICSYLKLLVLPAGNRNQFSSILKEAAPCQLPASRRVGAMTNCAPSSKCVVKHAQQNVHPLWLVCADGLFGVKSRIHLTCLEKKVFDARYVFVPGCGSVVRELEHVFVQHLLNASHNCLPSM